MPTLSIEITLRQLAVLNREGASGVGKQMDDPAAPDLTGEQVAEFVIKRYIKGKHDMRRANDRKSLTDDEVQRIIAER